MGGALAIDGPLQGVGDRLLPHHLVEGARSIAAGQDLVAGIELVGGIGHACPRVRPLRVQGLGLDGGMAKRRAAR